MEKDGEGWSWSKPRAISWGRNRRQRIDGGCDCPTLKLFNQDKFEDGWVAKGLGVGPGCVGWRRPKEWGRGGEVTRDLN